MTSHAPSLPQPADDPDESGALAQELASAYRRMAAFYHKQLNLSGPDADARARGRDSTPEEAVADLDRIREQPPDEVSWYDLERLVERDPEATVAIWTEVKAAAREELASGHRAARALDWEGDPWARARFLAIRANLRGDTPPASGIEAALVDMAAEAYSVWLEESEHAHMLASGEISRERLELERDGGYAPPRLVMAEAIEQAAGRAERAHKRFLQTVKSLTDLQRLAPSVYVKHAGQINVGRQQVNVATTSTQTSGESKDLPK